MNHRSPVYVVDNRRCLVLPLRFSLLSLFPRGVNGATERGKSDARELGRTFAACCSNRFRIANESASTMR